MLWHKILSSISLIALKEHLLVEFQNYLSCYLHLFKYVISRENLANEGLRNCDVRQVLCILTIFCRFKPKNVCILPKFSSFQLFQSKIILVKSVVKKSLSLQLSNFSNFSCLSVNIFVCKFVYIVRSDQNPFGSCQPFSILYIL